MSKLMENQIVATKHQMDTIIDILIENKLITKDRFMEMMKEKLDETLMTEKEKHEILSLVDL